MSMVKRYPLKPFLNGGKEGMKENGGVGDFKNDIFHILKEPL
jgi:hypothetical protein